MYICQKHVDMKIMPKIKPSKSIKPHSTCTYWNCDNLLMSPFHKKQDKIKYQQQACINIIKKMDAIYHKRLNKMLSKNICCLKILQI